MSDTQIVERKELPERRCPERPPQKPCGPDPTTDLSEYNDRYDLYGPQAEPQAGWWLEPVESPIRVPRLDEVRREVARRSADAGSIFPFFQSQDELQADLDQLRSDFIEKRRELPGSDDAENSTPLSLFLNLQKQPFGALFNTTYDQFRVDCVLDQQDRLGRPGYEYVRTGEELARLFQRETPGLYHHHALHWFLYEREDISAPRHARIWMALNLTIYAALSAAWYYKWAYNTDNCPAPRVSFAIRPYEAVRTSSNCGPKDPEPFVLYDCEPALDGDGSNGPRGEPCPSPGTPRHPAYPSGHSTYSAAASRILTYFFGDNRVGNSTAAVELRRLADNIGEARLFGGVHWIRDHRFGQLVGEAVADLVIRQLQRDCVPRLIGVPPMMQPPTAAEVLAFRLRECGNPDPAQRDHDRIPPRPPRPSGAPAAL